MSTRINTKSHICYYTTATLPSDKTKTENTTILMVTTRRSLQNLLKQVARVHLTWQNSNTSCELTLHIITWIIICLHVQRTHGLSTEPAPQPPPVQLLNISLHQFLGWKQCSRLNLLLHPSFKQICLSSPDSLHFRLFSRPLDLMYVVCLQQFLRQ